MMALPTCRGWVQTGALGGHNVGPQHGNDEQPILFSCIEFYSTECTFDVTNTDLMNNLGSYMTAMRAFAECAERNMEAPGAYCHPRQNRDLRASAHAVPPTPTTGWREHQHRVPHQGAVQDQHARNLQLPWALRLWPRRLHWRGRRCLHGRQRVQSRGDRRNEHDQRRARVRGAGKTDATLHSGRAAAPDLPRLADRASRPAATASPTWKYIFPAIRQRRRGASSSPARLRAAT